MHRRHVYVQFDLWLKDRLALEQHTVRRSQKVPPVGHNCDDVSVRSLGLSSEESLPDLSSEVAYTRI